MKFGLAVLAILGLCACSGETPAFLPTQPAPPAPASPPPGSPGVLWIQVFTDDDCPGDATIQVVGEAGELGEKLRQEPCDYWGFGGIYVHGLTTGTTVKVRASAPGYVTQERSFLPFAKYGPVSAVHIVLPRAE